MTGLVVET